MKRSGTFLVSTAGIEFALLESAKDEKAHAWLSKGVEKTERKTLAMARELGVKIAGGMDATSASLQGRNALQLEALVKLGATPIEALRSETVSAAELLGVLDRTRVQSSRASWRTSSRSRATPSWTSPPWSTSSS